MTRWHKAEFEIVEKDDDGSDIRSHVQGYVSPDGFFGFYKKEYEDGYFVAYMAHHLPTGMTVKESGFRTPKAARQFCNVLSHETQNWAFTEPRYVAKEHLKARDMAVLSM